MGLFDNLFTKKAEEPAQEATSQPTNSQPVGMLNLKKNDILDLTKTSAHYDSLRLSAGWDINKKGGSNYDLDLFALLLDSKDKLTSVTNPCVYYGNKKATGIELDKDNLTGEGDGDDENIFINLTKIPPAVNKIILAVSIYDADSRRQSFQYVNNAYVRLVDTSNKKEVEICRYNLSNEGGNSTAVICAELFRNGSDWSFKAVGDFTKGSISQIKNKY